MKSLHDVNAEEWSGRLERTRELYHLKNRFRVGLKCVLEAKPERWLDIGAGNGYLAAEVKKRLPAVHVTGVDFVAEALAQATALDAAEVLDLNVQPLPVDVGSIDYVTCLEVLEHVLFPREVLKEIARVLKPGGKALLSVPNLQYIEYIAQLARGKVPHPAADERHMSIFTLRHLRKLARSAGLRGVRAFGADASPAWAAKLSKKYFAKTILLEVEKVADGRG